MDKSGPYEFVPVKDFAAAFLESADGLKMAEELQLPFDQSKSPEGALAFEQFAMSTYEMVKISFDKEWLLVQRNAFIYIFKSCQIGPMALIAMAVFSQTTMRRDSLDNAQIYAGALFFGVSNIMFNGYSELSLIIIRLPVFCRQRDMLFFPAWCFSLATWILSIPISAVETITWCIITYYTVGFAPSAQRFFRQLFIYCWFHQLAASLFRIIAGCARSMVLSNTGGTFALLGVFARTGFPIRTPEIKGRWICGYWVSPLTYAQNGVIVNEFLAPQWNVYLDGNPEPLGYRYLKSAGVFAHSYWYWIGVKALIGYPFLFNFLFTSTVTYLGPLGRTYPQSPDCGSPGVLLPDLEYLRRLFNHTHESTSVGTMVLLRVPNSLDSVWSVCHSIWRRAYQSYFHGSHAPTTSSFTVHVRLLQLP